MKVFLIDNNRVNKYMLPSKIDDTFLITYNNGNKDILITLEGKNNEVYLKSNGTVDIIDNNEVVNEIKIKLYDRYVLKVAGLPNNLEIYFMPAKESLFKLDFKNLDSFSVGSSEACHICYQEGYLTSVEAMFKSVGDEWVVSTVNDDNYKVYINNNRLTLKKLKAGDIIFLGGLKLVWMNNFICVNNPKNKLKVTGMSLIEDKESNEEIKEVLEEDKYVELYDKSEYFAHYPSIRETIYEHEVVIDAPPPSEKENKNPFIVQFGTTLVMLASSSVMAYNVIYGIISGRNIWSLIPQMVMGVAMLIGSLVIPKIASGIKRKNSVKNEEKRISRYKEYLLDKERELGNLIKNELQIMNDNYPSADNCVSIIENKNKNFWWCQYNDKEFLNIRVGTGRVKSNVLITAPEKHFTLQEDELLSEVYKVASRYEYIEGAPITLSLKDNAITSIICNSNNKIDFINSLIVQLIALHSSVDVKLVLFTNQNNLIRWEFFKYLPHAFSKDLSVRFFASNIDEAKIVSSYLEEELKKRKEESVDAEKRDVYPNPYYLIITDDYFNMKNIPIVDELVNKKINEYGFSLLVIEDDIKQVPNTTTAFIEASDKDGAVISKESGLNSQRVFYISKTSKELEMKSLAKFLLNIPVKSEAGPSVLPSSLGFLDMFGVSKIEQLNIINRWQSNNPVVSLDTVVGVHADGEKFMLDLHEKFHGPHGLIAGSTGSGKSEFIITYILSMIINYHPYEVEFVLIDYKGGGLAGAFENKELGIKIPHLVGTITNLDVAEMNRSLVSIQSELNRRQKLFNETRDALGEGTIDIYKYQKLYREGVVKKPLAHLFIICDEFAELKQQRPEFMQQLISASRIGRSLGIHLILATQKPSGVVNDQIWANSKFKVCLKVQDRGDSMEMLKRPEAASIKEAGRFYLQVGYNDYFDIGQSGWSGAKYQPSDRIVLKTDESLNFINNVGYVTKSIKDVKVTNDKDKDYGDQLTNIVKYIYNLGKRENIVTNQLWLPSIPKVIYLNDLKNKYHYEATPYVIAPLIGEYDDPVNQLQNKLTIDLTNKGNLVIYGNSGSGKEKLLSTLIRSVVTEHNPDEVNIYIADCGSESLKIFNSFPHVGDIVTVDSPDKMQDLFAFVSREIEKRKELFADYAGSYTDYIANSGKKLPLIITIINNYDVFSENFSRLSDMINPLFRDGHKYGVVFVVSAIATNAIRSRSTQYFENKIALQLSQDYDYREIVKAPKGITPAKIFGRGMVLIGDSGYEFQTASFATDKEFTNSLRELSKVLNNAYVAKASKIPTIPEKINVYDLIDKQYEDGVPVGYNIDTKEITTFNFDTGSIIPIVATNIDEVKISFVHALIREFSLNKGNFVQVIDFANAFPKNMENVSLVKDKYEEAFVKMNNEILKNDGKERYYFILGASFLPSKISKELYTAIGNLFKNIKNYKNIHIIFVDVSNGLRELMLEDWASAIDTNNGIWLGGNAGTQSILHMPNLSTDEKRLDFPYLAFLVRRGAHEAIKHMLDMEEEL